MRRSRRPARELRRAIDAMPLATREAMLSGISSNPIIVGAYVGPEGGICPMLAAHRSGGRTRYAEFAKAWDRYAGDCRKPRPATEREMATLRAMLEASIAEGDVRTGASLRRAIVEHRRSQFARARREEHEVAAGSPCAPEEPEALPGVLDGPKPSEIPVVRAARLPMLATSGSVPRERI